MPDTIQKSKSRSRELSARLASLTVWEVAKIRLTRKIDGVEGAEDSGIVVFDDTNKDKLDIYFSSDPTKQALLDCKLSEELIKHCEISQPEYKALVLKILILPLSHIERYLEDYDLDNPDVANQMDLNDEAFSSLEQFDGDSSETAISLIAIGTPPSVRPGCSESPLSLQETIPTLDQTISSVRQAASSQETQPSRLTLNFRSGNDAQTAKARSHLEAEINGSGIGSDRPSPAGSRPQSSSQSREDRGNFSFGGTFARDLRSTLPKIDPSGTPRTARSRSRQPNNIREEPHDDDTEQRLHNKLIGVLGEVFVSTKPSYTN